MNAAASQRAVLFPGQGSQEKGMGRDLAEADSRAMELWILGEKASGLKLREIYWDGEPADMAATDALQPAMTAVTLGFWFYRAAALAPMALAGHSLGEYAALAAAAAIDPREAMELTALRGKLMDQAGKDSTGKMAALLKLTQDQAGELVEKAKSQTGAPLYLANYNSPGQFVISGEAKAVEAAAALAKEYKGRAVVLPVSGAFHTPAMDQAAAELAKVLAKCHFKSPNIPVYLNVTAAAEPGAEKIRAIMGRQMTSPVRWIETMRAMYAAGARTFVELGPKGVLAKLAGLNLEGVPEEVCAVRIGTLEEAAAFAG